MDKKVDRLCVFAELYQDYLELCLKREVGREKLRAAVMEKTLGAVILTGLAMLGAAVWAYIREHLK